MCFCVWAPLPHVPDTCCTPFCHFQVWLCYFSAKAGVSLLLCVDLRGLSFKPAQLCCERQVIGLCNHRWLQVQLDPAVPQHDLSLRLWFLLDQPHSWTDFTQVVTVWLTEVQPSVFSWKRSCIKPSKLGFPCFDKGHVLTLESIPMSPNISGHRLLLP